MPVVEESPHLDPARFNQPADVVLRHIRRYLDAVELFGRTGEDECWVDFGCGSGYGTAMLGNFCSRPFGVDIDRAAIKRAKERHPGIAFSTCLPTAERVIHNVFCIEMIEHVGMGQAVDVLTRLRQSVTEGGSVIVSTPIVPRFTESPTNPHHACEYSKAAFRSLAKTAGLEVIDESSSRVTFTDGETKQQGIFVLR